MKVIDLLNKIANGENIKNIKYQNHIYEYYNGDFREEIDGPYDSNWLFANEIIDLSNLNDEIEILGNLEEENKTPEKITMCTSGIMGFVAVEHITTELKDKINEICDYLKSKGE